MHHPILMSGVQVRRARGGEHRRIVDLVCNCCCAVVERLSSSPPVRVKTYDNKAKQTLHALTTAPYGGVATDINVN